MPDIFIIKSESENTKEISRTVFHELAHASHCTKVGASYWASYIGQIVLNLGYGNSATNNNGIIGVGEMWGYYFDKICIEQYMNLQGVDVKHSGDWFRPQILVRLDNEITDVTPAMIFSHYTPSIRSHADLKQSLKSYYSSTFNLGACLQVDEIFESNGF